MEIANAISDELNNLLGVPQGSILGPLLFILYVIDITNCLKHCEAKLFADDTIINVVTDRLDEETSKLNEDLGVLFNQLYWNNLKLIIDKTKALVVNNKNIDTNDVNIYRYINEIRLEVVKEIKYLGTIIDDKLSLARIWAIFEKK